MLFMQHVNYLMYRYLCHLHCYLLVLPPIAVQTKWVAFQVTLLAFFSLCICAIKFTIIRTSLLCKKNLRISVFSFTQLGLPLLTWSSLPSFLYICNIIKICHFIFILLYSCYMNHGYDVLVHISGL